MKRLFFLVATPAALLEVAFHFYQGTIKTLGLNKILLTKIEHFGVYNLPHILSFLFVHTIQKYNDIEVIGLRVIHITSLHLMRFNIPVK